MAMKRGYTVLEYKSVIRKLRAIRPDRATAALGGFVDKTMGSKYVNQDAFDVWDQVQDDGARSLQAAAVDRVELVEAADEAIVNGLGLGLRRDGLLLPLLQDHALRLHRHGAESCTSCPESQIGRAHV